VLFVVARSISFGSLRIDEQTAIEEGNLFGGKEPINDLVGSSGETVETNSTAADFLIPIAAFIGIIMGGLVFLIIRLGITSIDQMTIFKLFFYGGFVAVIVSALFLWMRSRITVNQMYRSVINGYEMMFGSIVLLLLAWIFSELLRSHLGTGQYMATLVVGTVPVSFLPIIFFFISLLTGLGIGSSWGTIALVLPIALPLLIQIATIEPGTSVTFVPFFFPLLGAIFSGAVAGDHLSPVSGTSIMTATGAQTYLADHIRTQFWYALPALLVTIATFGSFCFFDEHTLILPIRLGIGIVITCGTLLILRSR
jgi:Na+/H+ antiporter NhaC